MKRNPVQYTVERFLIIQDGKRWGIAEYAVDTTRQNMPYYRVRKWYTEAHEASSALQTLKELYG